MTKSRLLNLAWLFTIATCFLVSCDQSARKPAEAMASSDATSPPASAAPTPRRKAPISPIVAAARSQVGKTVIYDPAYVGLAYPGGDVPIERGVCTDVVIRALRDGLNIDLQKLIHEDMSAAFPEYPAIWGLKRPDPNIDHRRVPNLRCYFERNGYSLGVSQERQEFLPGDFVTCIVGRNRPHIMIVSDKKTSEGVPLVIHNIGSGAKEEHRLFDFPMTGHYRITTAASSNKRSGAEVQ